MVFVPDIPSIRDRVAERYMAQTYDLLAGPNQTTTDGRTDMSRALRTRYRYVDKYAADGMAADTTAARAVIHAPTEAVNGIRLIAASYIPTANLTANSTDYAVFEVVNSSGPAVLLSRTTRLVGAGGTGDWTIYVPVNLSSSVVPLPSGVLLPGQVAYFDIAKANAGVIVPAGTMLLEWEVL